MNMMLSRFTGFITFSNLRCYTTKAVKLINVTIDEDTSYATVVLNKPPVNSLDTELLREISMVLTSLENQKVRGMILTSSLATVFSAGLDIMEMYQPKVDRLKVFWTVLQDVWMQLYLTTFPTVAVINGHSPAGGCFLASSCEHRIMLKNYTIGLNETRLGIIAPPWFIKPFQNLVGKRKAESALISGRMFSTDEALQLGIVDEVADSTTDAISKAEEFLNQFEIMSPLARYETKKYFRGKDVEELRRNREQDLQNFISAIQLPIVQQSLEFYLAILKSKKDDL